MDRTGEMTIEEIYKKCEHIVDSYILKLDELNTKFSKGLNMSCIQEHKWNFVTSACMDCKRYFEKNNKMDIYIIKHIVKRSMFWTYEDPKTQKIRV